MKNILKKLIYVSLFLIIGKVNLFSQSYEIDYYGIVSSELDSNMAKMTSDLYYTQLTEIPNFTIYDKRTTPNRTTIPDFSNINTDSLIFYAEVLNNHQKDNWSVIFSVIDKEKDQQYSKEKTYDSFYKILIESKNELKDTIKELISENPQYRITKNKTTNEISDRAQGKRTTVNSLEELSGTWIGEQEIDKIVILRGGRGFVFFNNGASMTISISLLKNGEEILIKQKDKSNASYYPDLPRNIAVEAAVSAPPIQWNMYLLDDMTLNGKKNTLIPTEDGYTQGTVNVSWEKLQ